MKLPPAELVGAAVNYYGYYSPTPAIFNLHPYRFLPRRSQDDALT